MMRFGESLESPRTPVKVWISTIASWPA